MEKDLLDSLIMTKHQMKIYILTSCLSRTALSRPSKNVYNSKRNPANGVRLICRIVKKKNLL